MKLPGNMQAMMQQAEQMQQKMQEEIALIRVEASAGGGMVTVHMDGQKNVTAVKIDPEVAGDVEMLQDMVMAAFNEAAKKVDEETQRRWAGCWAAWAFRRACSSFQPCPISPNRSQRLIQEFKRLPGIGQKSAQRLAFHVLRTPGKTPSAWRKRCLMSKTNSAFAPSATTSATASCAITAAIRIATASRDLRSGGAAQYPADRDDAPV